MRLAHLSDIHFGGENREALAAATDFLASHPVDLTVITGDITLYGAVEEFAAARRWLARLNGPVLATPGNHDTPWAGLFDRMTAPFERYEAAVGPSREASFARSGLFARCLNTARGWQLRLNWSKGAVSAGQVRRGSAAFAAAPAEATRLLACHHPLVEIPGEPITAGVRGGARAAAAFAAAGVDVILSGHLHAAFVEALPVGDGATLAVGAGTLSLRERGEPASFNLIELGEDELAVTVMAFENGRLSHAPARAAPLRRRRHRS